VTYHGKAVKKFKVIYAANEGANGVGRKRIPAWMAAHGIPPKERCNIYLITVPTILPNETARNNLLTSIHAIVTPGEDYLLSTCFAGHNLGRKTTTRLPLHGPTPPKFLLPTARRFSHLRIAPTVTMAGREVILSTWGSWDTRLQSEGDKEKRTTVLKVERHKEHDSQGQWGFQLDEVEVEEHPGEFSLVPRLDGEVKAKKTGAGNLPGRAAAAFKTLQYALNEVGAVPAACNHIPANVKCVTIEQWRDYSLRMGISTSDDERARKTGLQDRFPNAWLMKIRLGFGESTYGYANADNHRITTITAGICDHL
jgi:hypothetical protein